MDESRASLTVYFEAPFWVGLYQREWNGQCQVCKITFGAEPKDYEVYQFLLDNWRRLRFSPPVAAGRIEQRRINPKRMQREIKKQLQSAGAAGMDTKAQQALKLQQEAGKQARKVRSRTEKEAEQERKFAQRRETRKAKHRGR